MFLKYNDDFLTPHILIHPHQRNQMYGIEEQMTQHKDQILINVAQILNDKLQNIQLQPKGSILEESKADIV